MRRGRFSKNAIAFVVLVVSVSCLSVLILSVRRLPDVSFSNGGVMSVKLRKTSKIPQKNERIGKFAEMMVDMLPQDLSFTIFVPSDKAFEHDLRLRVNDSFVGEKANDTEAILTRVLGFTVVPWKILSESLLYGKEINFDSLSGFRLYASKDSHGMLIVNGVRSEWVDLRMREIVIHVMDGVIIEADFEQSVRPDDDEED